MEENYESYYSNGPFVPSLLKEYSDRKKELKQVSGRIPSNPNLAGIVSYEAAVHPARF